MNKKIAGKKLVVFSGMAPSGTLTIGNYAGALRNWIALKKTHDCFFAIVDMHALTVRQNPEDMRRRSYEFLASFLAAGIDHSFSTVFIQSHVSAHARLAWILNCFTYSGELSRMTQFKDKSEKHEKNINAGLFTYPVLMASDILLYQTDLVPVGEDQKQHVELARNLAIRFNNIYSETFRVPEPLIPVAGKRIMNLKDPTKKMDKSTEDLNSIITLIDEPDAITNKIKRAVTDSNGTIEYNDKRPGISNLLSIYSIFANGSIENIVKRYHGQGYATFKKDLCELLIESIRPIREKYQHLMNNVDYLDSVLSDGAEKASTRASKTLQEVQRKVGFIQLD